MKKIFLVLLSLFSILSIMHALQLTSEESDFIDNKKQLTILLSGNNPPYEFYDSEGKLVGINVDIINEMMNLLKIKYRLVTDITYGTDIDMISSLAITNLYFPLQSTKFYSVKVSILTHQNNTNFTTNSDIYLIDQEITKQIVLTKNKKVFTHHFEEVNDAFFSFINDDNSFLIIDNFRLWEVKQLLKNTNKIVFINDMNKGYDFFFSVQRKDLILINILSKAYSELSLSNKITEIFLKWNALVKEQYNFTHNLKRIYAIFIITAILFFAFLAVIVQSKFLQKKSDKIINQKTQNILELSNHVEQLKQQVITIEGSNKNVLENINNIAITLDLHGNILFINSLVQKILGYTPEQLLGSNIKELITEEETKKLTAVFASNVSLDKVNSSEIIINSKEGLKKYFIYTSQLSKNTHDPVINCVLQDITERKTLETRLESYTNHLEDLIKQRTQTLRDSEERFKLVVEKSNDGIYLQNDEKIFFSNSKFIYMLNLSFSDLNDKNLKIADFINPSLKEMFASTYEKYKTNQESSAQIEVMLLDIYGNNLNVELIITPAIFNNKHVEMGIVRDITEKKKLEEEKLEREKLMSINHLAITANDRINSPLNAILGYAELLETKYPTFDKQTQNAFKNIYSSIEKIEYIMKKLKSLSSINLKEYKLQDTQMLSLDEDLEEDILGEDKND